MRAIIIGAGLAMSASWGMTWIQPPFFGAAVSPASLISDGTLELSRDAPWQTWVFVVGFGAAVLAVLLALSARRGPGRVWHRAGHRARAGDRGVGAAACGAALVAGLSPPVVLGDAMIGAEDLHSDFGLPFAVNLGDLLETWTLVESFIRPGLWVYCSGAAVLLIAGLTGLARFAGRR